MLSETQVKTLRNEKEKIMEMISEMRTVIDGLVIKGIRNFDGSDMELLNDLVAKSRELGLARLSNVFNSIVKVGTEKTPENLTVSFESMQRVISYLKALDRELSTVNITIKKHVKKD